MPPTPRHPKAPDAPPLRPHVIKGMGWRPDKPDQRDKAFDTARHLRRLGGKQKLPSSFDLRRQDPAGSLGRWSADPGWTPFLPILDQGNLGSCTANAIGKAYAYQVWAQGQEPYTPSRLFIYYGEREIEGTIGTDAGAEIRDGLKVVNLLGAPHETTWPYQIGRFTARPDQRAYDDGLLNQALAYESVDVKSLAVKTAIASGHPVVIGFSVYSSFYYIGEDGMMPVPSPRDSLEGGHAVLVVGYVWRSVPVQTKRGLRKMPRLYAVCLNSWGPEFGDGGFFYMPMAWLCDRANADDFWCITITEDNA